MIVLGVDIGNAGAVAFLEDSVPGLVPGTVEVHDAVLGAGRRAGPPPMPLHPAIVARARTTCCLSDLLTPPARKRTMRDAPANRGTKHLDKCDKIRGPCGPVA
jgi:hypothetical protein